MGIAPEASNRKTGVFVQALVIKGVRHAKIDKEFAGFLILNLPALDRRVPRNAGQESSKPGCFDT